MSALHTSFDALLFDLDGVIYVGPDAVAHAAPAVGEAHDAGVRCAYVTNNAFRPPHVVVEHLQGLGFPCTDDDVVTSPQAAVPLLATVVAPGAKVLVIGGEGIASALRAGGYQPVSSLDDAPAAIMQGFSPDLGWRDLAEASYAVASGLPWIVTNPDLTFPTPRGLAPGNGSMAAVVAAVTGRRPDAVAGKPERPLLDAAVARTGATRPLMVGDRLDTDIAAGHRAGMPALAVLTGVCTPDELLRAQGEDRPDYIGVDLRVLQEEYPAVVVDGTEAICRDARARVVQGRVEPVSGQGIDLLRAAAALAWAHPDADPAPSAQALAGLSGRAGAAGSVSGEGRRADGSASPGNEEDHHAQ